LTYAFTTNALFEIRITRMQLSKTKKPNP